MATHPLAMAAPSPSPRACDECPFGACKFSRKRTHLYLTVWWAARGHREPFEHVLRNRVRDSRFTDPAIRSASFSSDEIVADARAIGWTLDELAKQHGLRFMHPGNASAVAAALCPERHNEAPD